MLKIELITPQKKILEKEASEVVVSTLAGEIGILEGHANLLSIIQKSVESIKFFSNSSDNFFSSGLLVIHNQGEKNYFAVHHGFVQVKSGKVPLLLNFARKK